MPSPYIEIPLPTSTEPLFTQSTQLEGQTYTLTFDWNSRTDRWTFSMETVGGTRVIDGALLCGKVDLLRTLPSTYDYVPPGQLYVAGEDDPTLATIGNVSLIYVPST